MKRANPSLKLKEMKDITVVELKKKKKAGEPIQLLDVREAHEREEYNIGGTFVPLGQLPKKLDDLPFDKDKEIVVYCRSGNRSGIAKELMVNNGFKKTRNLLGGMLEWSQEEAKD